MFKKIGIFTLKILTYLLLASVGLGLAFYASGWRYNFKTKKFTRVGLISVRSDPRGAAVYLDNNFKGVTPLKIKNVVPGFYQLKVEKDNYEVYEKNVLVRTDLATEENNIELFLKQREEEVLLKNCVRFILSADQETAYALSKSKVFEINLENKVAKEIFAPTTKLANSNQLKLSENEKRILAPPFILSGREFADNQNINKIFGIDFDDLFFVRNQLYLLGLKKRKLYLLDYVLEKKYPLIKNVSSFATHDKKIYAIQKSGKEILIYDTAQGKFEKPLKKEIIAHDDLDKEKKLVPLKIDGGRLLAPKNQDKIYFISHDNILLDITTEPKIVAKDFAAGEFDNLERFIFWLGSEIRLYEDLNKETRVVARYSEDLRKVVWHKDFYNIFFTTGSDLAVIDDDGMSYLSLYKAKDSLSDFSIFYQGKKTYLLLLDGDELKKIRVQ